MQHVYLIKNHDHDGDLFLGAFDTEEAAREFQQKASDEGGPFYLWCLPISGAAEALAEYTNGGTWKHGLPNLEE